MTPNCRLFTKFEFIPGIDIWHTYHKKVKVKVSSYMAQYPILRTAQSALHFTSLTDLFNQTPSQLLLEASSHILQLMRKDCSYTYPPLSIARYSLMQLSENLPKVLTPQHRIRIRVLLVESPKLYPWATAFSTGSPPYLYLHIYCSCL